MLYFKITQKTCGYVPLVKQYIYYICIQIWFHPLLNGIYISTML